jgi:hypothetical protein
MGQELVAERKTKLAEAFAMPSPFPGMDPFLENPEVFPDFHRSFLVYLRAAVQPLLPKNYFAALELREWLELGRTIIPDVKIKKRPRPRPKPNGGGTAVKAMRRTEPLILKEAEEEHREAYVSIYRKRARDRQLVTSIELLSPSNKSPGSEGRKLFQEKQQQLLRAGVNLVEIDLLRGGKHTTRVPEQVLWMGAQAFDYHVCVTRGEEPTTYRTYPFSLEGALPAIDIPLAPDDPDVPADLQIVITRTFEDGDYERQGVYDHPIPPGPALNSKRSAWVNRLLRQHHPR